MTELAKWAWLILVIILFIGPYIFVVLGIDIVVVLLVWWLKPEWLKPEWLKPEWLKHF